ncbi:MAG: endonuclease/exonuclease/phosphatase family protein [Armatimonadota bacterium]|nr:endonuclease/exonuclease/phosphatase family protein [Armatimonadota bacterium]MDR7450909.1 endonuclease/exonuclease/phosphatase family protein [Armatimonadota bacterium]MDR7465831.1 endonuclease/exonuclease/phosphatase family protein [Armatimonadota bacterium]MDR7493739.1 endonuclease/exonuclease/phosphatase family protein [Armatimonadota bacterium]MDR7498345.1 endonuclease/exonuclease/phosphatase family protein [Armatimonadota bacterium]
MTRSQVAAWLVAMTLVYGAVPIQAPAPVDATAAPSCEVPQVCPIGAVQGAVGDTVDGRRFRSPFAPPRGNGAGATVRIQGVLYEKTLARTTAGESRYGFFLQNPDTTADGDPLTSDGIFVFTGRSPTVPPRAGGSSYTPRVGDEIVLEGRVTEFFNLTEITEPRWVATVRTGVDIDAEVAPVEAAPPDEVAAAGRYWERLEGMRVLVPAGSLVVGGRIVFPRTRDGELWLMRPDHPLARRQAVFHRRVFRDPHPLDDIPELLFDNGNGFRIVLGSLGIKGATASPAALIAPARTFDRLAGPATGGVYFSFGKYQLMVDRQIALRPGPDPSTNGPAPGRDPGEVRIVTFNVDNLYDFRDDPADGCDFAGNPGCPGVEPPFDYVPASDAAYRRKVRELAAQLLTDLHAPDIVLVQEAEDQDFCRRRGLSLACDGGDGQPDVLQDLALEIARLGGPDYRAAADRDGADDRGIINAYLFRSDRIELPPAAEDHPILGSLPRIPYPEMGLGHNADVQNPKAVNAALPAGALRGADGTKVFTRPVQVALFRVRRALPGAAPVELYILNNHFSGGPTGRVAQRREQAAYNAALVAALRAMSPRVYVVVGGDLNAYPRPDDPSAPGELSSFSDQLRALYDAGLQNLWDVLVRRNPAGAYSYVFEGQAQTLDQLFVTTSLLHRLVRVWAAHLNSDWPAWHGGDGARGASDHDPQGADFRLRR